MKVFLVGTGTMGAGIAQVFAQFGHEVYMYDRDMSFVERGHGMVEKQLTRQQEKGRMTQEEATGLEKNRKPKKKNCKKSNQD